MPDTANTKNASSPKASPLLAKLTRITGILLLPICIAVAAYCYARLPLDTYWEIDEMAISQFGYHEETKLVFNTTMIYLGISLGLFGIYLVNRYNLRNKILFLITFFPAALGSILAGIFPMQTPFVDRTSTAQSNSILNISLHFTAGVILVLGFAFSILIFGLTVKKTNPKISMVSITLSLIALICAPIVFIITNSYLLAELAVAIPGIIWIALATMWPNSHDKKNRRPSTETTKPETPKQ